MVLYICGCVVALILLLCIAVSGGLGLEFFERDGDYIAIYPFKLLMILILAAFSWATVLIVALIAGHEMWED